MLFHDILTSQLAATKDELARYDLDLRLRLYGETATLLKWLANTGEAAVENLLYRRMQSSPAAAEYIAQVVGDLPGLRNDNTRKVIRKAIKMVRSGVTEHEAWATDDEDPLPNQPETWRPTEAEPDDAPIGPEVAPLEIPANLIVRHSDNMPRWNRHVNIVYIQDMDSVFQVCDNWWADYSIHPNAPEYDSNRYNKKYAEQLRISRPDSGYGRQLERVAKAVRQGKKVLIVASTDTMQGHVLAQEIARRALRTPAKIPTAQCVLGKDEGPITSFNDMGEIEDWEAKENPPLNPAASRRVLWLYPTDPAIRQAMWDKEFRRFKKLPLPGATPRPLQRTADMQPRNAADKLDRHFVKMANPLEEDAEHYGEWPHAFRVAMQDLGLEITAEAPDPEAIMHLWALGAPRFVDRRKLYTTANGDLAYEIRDFDDYARVIVSNLDGSAAVEDWPRHHLHRVVTIREFETEHVDTETGQTHVEKVRYLPRLDPDTEAEVRQMLEVYEIQKEDDRPFRHQTRKSTLAFSKDSAGNIYRRRVPYHLHETSVSSRFDDHDVDMLTARDMDALYSQMAVADCELDVMHWITSQEMDVATAAALSKDAGAWVNIQQRLDDKGNTRYAFHKEKDVRMALETMQKRTEVLLAKETLNRMQARQLHVLSQMKDHTDYVPLRDHEGNDILDATGKPILIPHLVKGLTVEEAEARYCPKLRPAIFHKLEVNDRTATVQKVTRIMTPLAQYLGLLPVTVAVDDEPLDAEAWKRRNKGRAMFNVTDVLKAHHTNYQWHPEGLQARITPKRAMHTPRYNEIAAQAETWHMHRLAIKFIRDMHAKFPQTWTEYTLEAIQGNTPHMPIWTDIVEAKPYDKHDTTVIHVERMEIPIQPLRLLPSQPMPTQHPSEVEPGYSLIHFHEDPCTYRRAFGWEVPSIYVPSPEETEQILTAMDLRARC